MIANAEEIIKKGIEIIGPRIKDGHCVFCGEEILKGGYCSCKKAEKVNPQTVKLKELASSLDSISVLGIKEFTQMLISRAYFPKKFSGMEFSDYIAETAEQKHNLQLIKDYTVNALKYYLQAVNLIFIGNFGNGKTMLMSIAGDEIIRQYGIQVKYANVYELSEQLKKSFDDKNRPASKIIEEYKTAPILILDDIDKVNPTPFMIDLMYGISNYRGDNKLPTWINANHSMKELEDNFYGEGSMSRFFENSIKAKFTGENWRLRT